MTRFLTTIAALALLAAPDLVAQYRSGLAGTGEIEVITTANPAAGAEISHTVPARRMWRVLTIDATLVTSATVANREPSIELQGAGAVRLARLFVGNTHVASTTLNYSWAAGLEPGAGPQSPNVRMGLPNGLTLSGGYIIKTTTQNIQAGDDWSAARILVESFTRPS